MCPCCIPELFKMPLLGQGAVVLDSAECDQVAKRIRIQSAPFSLKFQRSNRCLPAVPRLVVGDDDDDAPPTNADCGGPQSGLWKMSQAGLRFNDKASSRSTSSEMAGR